MPRKCIERSIELARRLETPCALVVSHSAGDEGLHAPELAAVALRPRPLVVARPGQGVVTPFAADGVPADQRSAVWTDFDPRTADYQIEKYKMHVFQYIPI